MDGMNETLNGETPAGRKRLLKVGYEPLPLSGKACFMRDWSNGEITRERLLTWESSYPTGANTGLRTGKFAVADIDLLDPEGAAEASSLVQVCLGMTSFERIGAKPGGALCYYNPQPISKITVKGRPPGASETDKPEKVEFLGIGQQLAAFGDHPDTRKPYRWPDANPLDCRVEDLLEVTPELIRQCAYAVRDLLLRLGYSDVKITGDISDDRVPSRPADDIDPVTFEMLRSMFAFVDPDCERTPDWIGWAYVIKETPLVDENGDEFEDFDREAFFNEWSSGALSPDHKPSNYEGSDDCEKTFNSLGEQTNQGNSKTVASLIWEARQSGYTGPTSAYTREEIEIYRVPEVSLVELLRGPAVDAPRYLTAKDVEEWFAPVAALNNQFAIVIAGKHAGRFVALSNPREPVFLDGTRFHLVFRDQKVAPPDTQDKSVPVSKLWEAWPSRRTVTGIEFVPPGSHSKLPEGAHNLWQGFAVEPKEGEAHKALLRHLKQHVCGSNDDLFLWLVAWLANLIQEPGNKPGVAIALHGEQGAGKTILYRYLEAIFGGHATAVDSPSLVVGNFNAHMAGLCLLGVEEGFWAGDRKAESRLKNLITAESIMMEQKGVDAIKINSHVHIMVTSNAGWAVPVAADDRRWAVFHVDPDHRNDKPYWKPIYDALSGDGPANLLHYLLNHKYERGLLFRPPMTKAKVDQAIQSMESVAQWWLDVLRGDRNPVAGRQSSKEQAKEPDGIFERETEKGTIYNDYLSWCDGARRFKGVTTSQFWQMLRNLVGQGYDETRPRNDVGGSGPRVAWFPQRDLCREAFAEAYGCTWSDLD